MSCIGNNEFNEGYPLNFITDIASNLSKDTATFYMEESFYLLSGTLSNTNMSMSIPKSKSA